MYAFFSHFDFSTSQKYQKNNRCGNSSFFFFFLFNFCFPFPIRPIGGMKVGKRKRGEGGGEGRAKKRQKQGGLFSFAYQKEGE